jgi:undecaprenyl diphosphate synthase
MAIIPDGNRRWAKERGLLPWKGHEKAIDVLRAIEDWCRTHPRIGTLTLWLFSTENWRRDATEIAVLMDMLERSLTKERQRFLKEKTRFVHSGRKDRIPRSLAALIETLELDTKDGDAFTLHLALDYGGKDEVLRAANKARSAEITEDTLTQGLDHPELPPIDFILRTSGEKRTSNFFLWQTTYSEWMFLEKYFPDLTEQDLNDALQEFDRRKRRFGT